MQDYKRQRPYDVYKKKDLVFQVCLFGIIVPLISFTLGYVLATGWQSKTKTMYVVKRSLKNTNCSVKNISALVRAFSKNSTNNIPYDTSDFMADEPILFIGGFPGSGTTLLRVMLDCHPLINCGPETRILPEILQFAEHFKSPKQLNRLEEAGLTGELVEEATMSFISKVLAYKLEESHGIACTKDPMIMKHIDVLSDNFSKSKFILVVRDGRAVVHSLVKRKVRIKSVNTENKTELLALWSEHASSMYNQCRNIGNEKCMMVAYENLVSHPKTTLLKVLRFLGMPWFEPMLEHHNCFGTEHEPDVSK